MKTVDIKGRDYIPVNERIKHFRANYPQHRLISSIVELSEGRCVFKAEIWDGDMLVATGHAYELDGSSYINKTSYLENCETSAWGRALGCFGIGLDTSVASAEEVQNAQLNQGKPSPTPKAAQKFTKERSATKAQMEIIRAMFKANGIVKEDAQQFIDWVERSEPLTEQSAQEFLDKFEEFHSAFVAHQLKTEDDIPY